MAYVICGTQRSSRTTCLCPCMLVCACCGYAYRILSAQLPTCQCMGQVSAVNALLAFGRLRPLEPGCRLHSAVWRPHALSLSRPPRAAPAGATLTLSSARALWRSPSARVWRRTAWCCSCRPQSARSASPTAPTIRGRCRWVPWHRPLLHLPCSAAEGLAIWPRPANGGGVQGPTCLPSTYLLGQSCCQTCRL